jgi:hypothetical protein
MGLSNFWPLKAVRSGSISPVAGRTCHLPSVSPSARKKPSFPARIRHREAVAVIERDDRTLAVPAIRQEHAPLDGSSASELEVELGDRLELGGCNRTDLRRGPALGQHPQSEALVHSVIKAINLRRAPQWGHSSTSMEKTRKSGSAHVERCESLLHSGAPPFAAAQSAGAALDVARSRAAAGTICSR